MTTEEIYAKLTEIFRDVFDDETLTIHASTTADDIEAWDSLIQITLLAAAEDAFDIRFDLKSTEKLKNVGELAELIESLV